jgi:hypothetical protein
MPDPTDVLSKYVKELKGLYPGLRGELQGR